MHALLNLATEYSVLCSSEACELSSNSVLSLRRHIHGPAGCYLSRVSYGDMTLNEKGWRAYQY